jgi:hypothetical protein
MKELANLKNLQNQSQPQSQFTYDVNFENQEVDDEKNDAIYLNNKQMISKYSTFNSSEGEELLENRSGRYQSDYSNELFPALAAETKSCIIITVRQTGSKGAEKEAHIIFSESGTTSEEICEAGASVFF